MNISILKLTVVGLSCFMIFACKEKKSYPNEKYPINPLEAKEVKLSEFVDSIKYIQLQSDSNCMLGKIVQIVLRNKYIYVFDASQKAIFIFNKEGRFIDKLDKYGGGNDEYSHISAFWIDENEENIEIIDNYKYLLTYSNLDFQLKNKIKLENRIVATTINKNRGFYYFSTHRYDNVVNNKLTNADVIVMRDGEIVKKLFDKKIITNNSYYDVYIESFTTNNKKELFVSLLYNNTFFKLDGLSAIPIITVDFGKYGIDNSIGLQSNTKQLEFLTKHFENKAAFPVLAINNTDLRVFFYLFAKNAGEPQDIHHYIEFKKTNKILHAKKIINDLTDFPREIRISTTALGGIAHEAWFEDYLVDIVLPAFEFDYNGYDENEKVFRSLGKVNSESNPIIILMKTKTDL